MHKIKRIEVPLYSAFILEIAVTDEMPKIIKRFRLPAETERFFAGVAKTGIRDGNYTRKSVTMILNPSQYPDTIKPSVIAHEAVHVKNVIFNEIGQHNDPNNDEAEAYLIEWIVSEACKFYRECTRE